MTNSDNTSKDVISVDTILKEAIVGKNWISFSESGQKTYDESKSKLHSLLISKLPEKQEGYRNDNSPTDIVEKMRGNYDYEDGYNSAITDMRKSIDEMFGVGDES